MPAAEGREPMEPGAPSPASNGAPPNGERRQASPEEQKTYEDFVGQLINVAYDEGTAKVIASQMKDAGDPVEAVANAAALVVSTVAASAGENDVPVSRPMIVRAAAELVGDIGQNMTEAAGLPPLDKKQFEGAYLRTMDLLGQRAAGMQRQNGGGAPPQEGAPPAGEPPMAPQEGRGRGLMPTR